MFENLSERLSGVFDRLTKQGTLSEDDVKSALREVRVALLEADVSLPVAREFVKKVESKATGSAVTKSVTPGQQVIKIVHDALIETLKGEGEPGDLKIDNPPAPILMVGLQGSGKTTTTGKLAKRLASREGKKSFNGVSRYLPSCSNGTTCDLGWSNWCRHSAGCGWRNSSSNCKTRQTTGYTGGV